MRALKYALAGLFCLGGGILSAAGIFALLTSVGIVNRYAKVTHTAHHLRIYEEMIIFGASLGNLWFLFGPAINVGTAGVIIFGLIAGIYVGSFAVCLAESIKAIPVLVRRTRMAEGLGFLVLAIALGKGIGGLVYYIWLYAGV